MTILVSQPEIRFSQAGPHGLEGISYVEKVVAFKKESISGTSDDDFWSAPAGVFITQAFLRIDVGVDGSGTVELGVDGNPDALIDTLDYTEATAGNWATNLGSANADNPNGLYLDAGDNVRLSVGGTPTVGAVSGFIKYFEVDAMLERGVHFDTT